MGVTTKYYLPDGVKPAILPHLEEAEEVLSIINDGRKPGLCFDVAGNPNIIDGSPTTRVGFIAAINSMAKELTACSIADIRRDLALDPVVAKVFKERVSHIWLGVMEMLDAFQHVVSQKSIYDEATKANNDLFSRLEEVFTTGKPDDMREATIAEWGVFLEKIEALTNDVFSPSVSGEAEKTETGSGEPRWPHAVESEMTPHVPEACEALRNLSTSWRTDEESPLELFKGAPVFAGVSRREWLERTFGYADRLMTGEKSAEEIAQNPRTVMYPYYAELMALIEKLWNASVGLADGNPAAFRASDAIRSHAVRLTKYMRFVADLAPREYLREAGHHWIVMMLLNFEFEQVLKNLPRSIKPPYDAKGVAACQYEVCYSFRFYWANLPRKSALPPAEFSAAVGGELEDIRKKLVSLAAALNIVEEEIAGAIESAGRKLLGGQDEIKGALDKIDKKIPDPPTMSHKALVALVVDVQTWGIPGVESVSDAISYIRKKVTETDEKFYSRCLKARQYAKDYAKNKPKTKKFGEDAVWRSVAKYAHRWWQDKKKKGELALTPILNRGAENI